ncbi:hypothetical protein DVH05_023024 [Phytophthora capsici]|nr:hypothetical protein DVH05_023024 [Phytophthora capsici]
MAQIRRILEIVVQLVRLVLLQGGTAPNMPVRREFVISKLDALLRTMIFTVMSLLPTLNHHRPPLQVQVSRCILDFLISMMLWLDS